MQPPAMCPSLARNVRPRGVYFPPTSHPLLTRNMRDSTSNVATTRPPQQHKFPSLARNARQRGYSVHHHSPARNEQQTKFTPTTATPLLETTDRKGIHAHHHSPARNERQTAFTPTTITPLHGRNSKNEHLCSILGFRLLLVPQNHQIIIFLLHYIILYYKNIFNLIKKTRHTRATGAGFWRVTPSRPVPVPRLPIPGYPRGFANL